MSDDTPEYVVQVLGGTRVFKGRAAPTAMEVRERIKEGLPYSAFEAVRERFQLSMPEAAMVLHVPLRTLARRRNERRLAGDESDRLYRLARIAAHAVSVLGSEGKVSAWLRRSNRALGGATPLDVLDTDIGVRQVEDILGRLDHGVAS